jgi:parvulin-like peptidyl-prolyl isomerase
MAKRQKTQRPTKMTRKYISRVEQERRQIRYIQIFGLVLLGVVVLLLVAGLYKTQIADPTATRDAEEALKTIPAATINGTMLSVADWQARVRYERQLRINQIAQISQQMNLFDPATELGQQFIKQGQAQIQEIQNLLDLGDGIAVDVLDQMVEEQLVRQEAARRGINITAEELQKYIEVDLFAYPFPPTPEPIPTFPPPTVPPTATVTPEPTLTPTVPPTPRSLEDFEADYRSFTDQMQQITGMSEEMWRAMIEGELYRQKLVEAFGMEAETNVPQIKGRYIVAEDQAAADTLLARLSAGETFEDLEGEVDADDSEAPPARTGSFDWSPEEIIRQRFSDEFADAAFATRPGDPVLDIIPSFDGRFYLILVEGNETRELPDYLVEQQRQGLFLSWLDEQKLGEGIMYGNWREYIPRDPSL